MKLLPPPPAPERPDLATPEPTAGRRLPAWAVVLSVLLAMVLVITALAPLLSARGPRHVSSFRFLGRTSQGDPTRWNPCEPIHYIVNASLAPPGSIADVHEAVSRISLATGIPFLYDGQTDEQPSVYRKSFQPDRFGDRWAPVLIAWVDPDRSDIPFEVPDRLVQGVALPVIPATRFDDVYVTGWVALNSDDPNPPGFRVPGDQGPVLLHELGHIMGLAHVDTMGELMDPYGGGMVDLGPGDREGLKELGREGGCIRVLLPQE